MTIDRKDLAALETILEKNPELLEKLRSSTGFQMTSRCLGEIAASNNIPFEIAEYEKFFNSIQESFLHRQISDTELQQVAAGGCQLPVGEMRYLTEDERRWYAFVYGTGVGALVLTSNSEDHKAGGGQEFLDAVYHGGKTNLAGHV